MLPCINIGEFHRGEMSCIDTFYINKSWWSKKKKIKVVPNMHYMHRLHGGSNYRKTANVREAFHRNRLFAELQKIQ